MSNLCKTKSYLRGNFFTPTIVFAMKITSNTRAIILAGIRNKGIKNIDLTRHLDKPKNWTTKLFNGTLKTLSEDDIDNLCDYLGISFLKVTEKGIALNPIAVKLSKLMDHET